MAVTRDVVVGVFRDRMEAQRAIEALKDAGFAANDISILMRDRDETRTMAEDTGASAGAGAATGAVAGGVLGGLAGWLVGIGALAIPGVGPFIAAGALASALGGAAIGAGVGAIAGALMGMGVPEEEANWYEREVRSGAALVTVRADGRFTEAQDILRRFGAYDVQTRDAALAGSDTGYDIAQPGTAGAMGEAAMLGYGDIEEGWDVYDRNGEKIGDVDRVEDDYLKLKKGFLGDRHPYIPLATVTRVEHDRVSTSVLKSEVEAGRYFRDETAATPPVAGSRWEEVQPRYRSVWEERHGPAGGDWATYEPSYRFGWEMRTTPRYRDRSWAEVEADLRREWQRRYPTTPWDRAMAGIREAWEGEIHVPVHEEQLIAQTHAQQAGEVAVHKDVVAEERTVNVPVTREEVEIERRPVNQPASAEASFEEDTIRVPVYEEEVTVQKQPVVKEEVVIRKTPVQSTEQVHESVRREAVQVDRGQRPKERWEEVQPRYRSVWEERHGPAGGDWATYEPYYRYGWEMAHDPHYHGRSWREVETDLRHDWEQRHPDTPWEQAADAIRDAWNHLTGAGARR